MSQGEERYQFYSGRAQLTLLPPVHIPKYKLGCLVKIKSGGPRMTVTGNNDPNLIEVVWFTRGHLQRAYFPADSLIKGR